MDPVATVLAVSDSPRIRETLCVLLEYECALRFLSSESLCAATALSVDLAVVAVEPTTQVLDALGSRWPTLPVVSVDVTTFGKHTCSATR